jgi:hypothetical protein
VLGGILSFNEMVACSGALGHVESAQNFDPPERTRFGFYARLLWDGLLEHEKVVNR